MEFIASIFHEARTPLDSNISFTKILVNEYYDKLTDRQLNYCTNILSAGGGLKTVINDILDLVKIEPASMKLKLNKVNIQPLIETVLNFIRERASEKTITLNSKYPNNFGWVIADEMRLKQSIFILLGKAICFISESGNINLSCSKDTTGLEISISFSGAGSPNAEQDKILKLLQLGYQSDTLIADQGRGLSIVARFIHLHRGKIKTLSLENGNTIIICRLPIASPALE